MNRKKLRVNWYSDLNWVFVGEEKKKKIVASVLAKKCLHVQVSFHEGKQVAKSMMSGKKQHNGNLCQKHNSPLLESFLQKLLYDKAKGCFP